MGDNKYFRSLIFALNFFHFFLFVVVVVLPPSKRYYGADRAWNTPLSCRLMSRSTPNLHFNPTAITNDIVVVFFDAWRLAGLTMSLLSNASMQISYDGKERITASPLAGLIFPFYSTLSKVSLFISFLFSFFLFSSSPYYLLPPSACDWLFLHLTWAKWCSFWLALFNWFWCQLLLDFIPTGMGSRISTNTHRHNSCCCYLLRPLYLNTNNTKILLPSLFFVLLVDRRREGIYRWMLVVLPPPYWFFSLFYLANDYCPYKSIKFL